MNKLPLLAGYLLLSIFLMSTRWSERVDAVQARCTRHLPNLLIGFFAFLALGIVLVFKDRPIIWGGVIACCAVFATTLAGQRKSTSVALSVVSGCALPILLLWWLAPEGVTAEQVLISLAVWFATSLALCAVGRTPTSRRFELALVSALLFTCWALMTFGSFETRSLRTTAWHHWGAYLAPVEAIRAGLVPFSDVPLQYGAGPTALLAMLPASEGFNAMRHVVLWLTLFGIYVVVDVCLYAVRPLNSRTTSIVAALAAASACLLWTAYPPDVGTAMVTPSTFALRFVPVFILLWTLVRFPSRILLGYAVWAVCTLWSIESAFYASVLFWPSRLHDFSEGNDQPSPSHKKKIVLISLKALGSFVILIAGWWLAYRMLFGVNPSPRIYIHYALFPPGPLPVNWI